MTSRNARRHWWTVILLYPGYMTDDYGEDIYVEWACTEKPEEAVPVVQRKAVEAQRDMSDEATADVVDPDDFKMIAVWKGRSRLELDASSAM